MDVDSRFAEGPVDSLLIVEATANGDAEGPPPLTSGSVMRLRNGVVTSPPCSTRPKARKISGVSHESV
jgi:hypothetical protein